MIVIAECLTPNVWEARLETDLGDTSVTCAMAPSEKRALEILQRKLERAAEAVRQSISELKE